jgi:hypothetical protein
MLIVDITLGSTARRSTLPTRLFSDGARSKDTRNGQQAWPLCIGGLNGLF